jgi:hypothetical protein
MSAKLQSAKYDEFSLALEMVEHLQIRAIEQSWSRPLLLKLE